jgi:hypothetical protein
VPVGKSKETVVKIEGEKVIVKEASSGGKLFIAPDVEWVGRDRDGNKVEVKGLKVHIISGKEYKGGGNND